MVYISSWQEYQEAAEALYENSPEKARYCVKWRASDGKLVLKVTDNVTCIKFKTNSSIFLNRFEALNLSLMQKMQNRQPKQIQAEAAKTETTEPLPQQTVPSSITPGTTGVSGSGGAKKKKQKKKKP